MSELNVNESEPTETVKLKDGSVEVKSLVVVTMLSLECLITNDPIAFYELVMRSRDREHQFFGSSGEHLEKLGLTIQGVVHNSTAAIVRNAVYGEDFSMRLGSPLERQEETTNVKTRME